MTRQSWLENSKSSRPQCEHSFNPKKGRRKEKEKEEKKKKKKKMQMQMQKKARFFVPTCDGAVVWRH
jgi:hypothetical protein